MGACIRSEVDHFFSFQFAGVCVCQPKGDGVALLPKNQREEEYFFAPKSTNKKKGGDGNKKAQKPKCIKHDLGTLQYFEECGVRRKQSDAGGEAELIEDDRMRRRS